MDVTWEYKVADDRAMDKDEKYEEWVQKYGEWIQKYNDGSENNTKGTQQTEQRSSKVYKRMSSVAVQTERSATVGTQTEEDDFLMALSDSLVVECSESEDDAEDEGHDSLF